MLLGLTRLLTTQLLVVVGSALGISVVKFAAADSEAMSCNNAETVDRYPFIVSHVTPVSNFALNSCTF